MKGWVFDSGLALRDDLPEPGGDRIVSVRATSVNPIDATLTSGVIGHDFAGVTDDGEEVFGFVRGAWAERIAAPSAMAPKPASLSMAEAGCAALAGAMALRYVESLGLTGGERVLIVGANGGVGAFAVQLCVAAGATVIAPALEIDAAYLQSLGVAEVPPRNSTAVADALIDLVSPPPAINADAAAVARLGALIDEHRLRVPICEGFNFGEVPFALEALADHKQGKLSVV